MIYLVNKKGSFAFEYIHISRQEVKKNLLY
jgi:hypothetical protein